MVCYKLPSESSPLYFRMLDRAHLALSFPKSFPPCRRPTQQGHKYMIELIRSPPPQSRDPLVILHAFRPAPQLLSSRPPRTRPLVLTRPEPTYFCALCVTGILGLEVGASSCTKESFVSCNTAADYQSPEPESSICEGWE